MRASIFLTVLGGVLVGCQTEAQVSRDPVYPGERWEYVWRDGRALKAYGWSSEGLQDAWEFIRHSSNTTGLIVVDRGRVVFQFGDVEELSYLTPLEEMNPIGRRGGYFGYGTMWWVWDGPRAVGPFAGAYTARGAVGQWITVLPAVDLVIAHKTNSVYSRTTSWHSWERFMELMLESKDGAEMAGSYPWR